MKRGSAEQSGVHELPPDITELQALATNVAQGIKIAKYVLALAIGGGGAGIYGLAAAPKAVEAAEHSGTNIEARLGAIEARLPKQKSTEEIEDGLRRQAARDAKIDAVVSDVAEIKAALFKRAGQ